jgi:hypothetical protein
MFNHMSENCLIISKFLPTYKILLAVLSISEWRKRPVISAQIIAITWAFNFGGRLQGTAKRQEE